MNEFIVWDKACRCFIDEHMVCLYGNGSLAYKGGGYINDGEICQYIGKTDIKSKKIFSDSSIIKVHDKKSIFYDDICKVSYCKNICAYRLYSIDFEDCNNEAIKPDYNKRYYEIVGTLQEDNLSEFKT